MPEPTPRGASTIHPDLAKAVVDAHWANARADAGSIAARNLTDPAPIVRTRLPKV